MTSLFAILIFIASLLWFSSTVKKKTEAFTFHIHLIFIAALIINFVVELVFLADYLSFIPTLVISTSLTVIYWLIMNIWMIVQSSKHKNRRLFWREFTGTLVVIIPPILFWLFLMTVQMKIGG